jgi:hypothetical protein
MYVYKRCLAVSVGNHKLRRDQIDATRWCGACYHKTKIPEEKKYNLHLLDAYLCAFLNKYTV